MSYFEEMTQKARAAVSTAAGKAREVADSAKISACECAGEEVPDAIADVIAAVLASQEKISELQTRREEAESAEATVPEEGKVCPVCGKISDTKFCPHCGAPME